MAIHLPKSDTLILLPTKVGSTWIRAALRAAGAEFVEVGPEEWRVHGDIDTHGRTASYIATFVRNPVTWYRSYWAYRIERGWRLHFDLDRECRHENFRDFIRNVTLKMPGFLTRMFERYTGPDSDPIDFIGKLETLADDVVRLLTIRQEKFDESALRSTDVRNATSVRPPLTSETIDLICIAEQEMLTRYGYQEVWSDPISLAKIQSIYPDAAEAIRRLVLWTERTHWEPDDAKRSAGAPFDDQTRYARCFGNFALFVQFIKNDAAAARQYYLAALERDARHPRTLANFAIYCHDVLENPVEAEHLFKRALDARPNHVHSIKMFARFLAMQGRTQEASELESRMPGRASA
jgi:hypothetical protein